MPLHAHWVIIAAKAPTAFRAKRRETLVPTLTQLQRTQPDAELRWFEGGRLWASPAEAEAARAERRRRPKRPSDWRPGGDHKDPRARFELSRDEKRARFKRRLRFDSDKPGAGPKPTSRGPQTPRRPRRGPK
jgi:hypothetical protein